MDASESGGISALDAVVIVMLLAFFAVCWGLALLLDRL
jgi:hypothetical protein